MGFGNGKKFGAGPSTSAKYTPLGVYGEGSIPPGSTTVSAVANTPALLHPSCEKVKKVNVINPIGEIRKIMDEVLFNEEYLALRRQQQEIDKKLDDLEQTMSEARDTIRDLYISSLPINEQVPTSLYDEDLPTSPTNRVVVSERGFVFFLGTAGPFIGRRVMEAPKEEEK